MMSMLASAMFYQAEGNAQPGQGYRLGPFKFTTHEMYISLVTSLIVLPVNILIDQLFRRSKPKKCIKEHAFSSERPFSALSRFSVKFTDLFRAQSRTQVSPIEDEKEESVEQGTSNPINTPPLARYQPTITDTPIPNVFVKSSEIPPSPTYFEARHHYTPAPPFFPDKFQNQTRAIGKRIPQLTLPIDEENLKLSSVESADPSPTNSGHLSACASSSIENSPSVSPRYVQVKSPTESVFTFDSSVEEIENITMKNSDKKRTRAYSKLVLPHWCVYIAWLFVFLSTSVSGTITFLYSMEWGKEKSIAWLTSMLLSVVESVSIIQPTKVI
jgi:hypothetical protein